LQKITMVVYFIKRSFSNGIYKTNLETMHLCRVFG
jgi:hypothetical protein